jgi:hypothetical protein
MFELVASLQVRRALETRTRIRNGSLGHKTTLGNVKDIPNEHSCAYTGRMAG